jgi:cell division septal protein FtsQ
MTDSFFKKGAIFLGVEIGGPAPTPTTKKNLLTLHIYIYKMLSGLVLGVFWGFVPAAPPKSTPQKIAPFLKKESVIPEL